MKQRMGRSLSMQNQQTLRDRTRNARGESNMQQAGTDTERGREAGASGARGGRMTSLRQRFAKLAQSGNRPADASNNRNGFDVIGKVCKQKTNTVNDMQYCTV